VWAKTSRLLVLGLVLLAGCGGSSKSQPSSTSDPTSSASAYPAQYKEAFFKAHECGSGGYSVANCECQIRYIEAHAPYSSLEEGAPEHAKAEEALNQAGSTCSEEAHTPAEEAAHNNAAKAQEEESKAYSEQEQKDKPEEEQLQKDKEKVEYEDGG
jgi:hypothetical protein